MIKTFFSPKGTALGAALLLAATPLSAQDNTVTVDGSSTVFPIVKAVGAAFEKETEGKIKVEVSYSGTSAGFRSFLDGKVDIVNASRPIHASELAQAKKNGLKYIELIIGYDALTLAVHPGNTWVDHLKVSELKKIWSSEAQGKVTHWNHVREDWPNEKIVLSGAGADSGTFDYFSEVITGEPKSLRSDYVASEDDTMIVESVATNLGGLGFVPYAYVVEAQDRIRAVPIAPDYNAITGQTVKARPVAPSARAVHKGHYVPLGRPLFMYVSVDALDKNPAVAQFVEFFLEKAPEFVAKTGYMALGEIAYDKGLRDIQNRVTGTRFGGEVVISVPHSDIYTLKQQ